jgi:hypothetical protein
MERTNRQEPGNSGARRVAFLLAEQSRKSGGLLDVGSGTMRQ